MLPRGVATAAALFVAQIDQCRAAAILPRDLDGVDDTINPLIDALPAFTYSMPVQLIVLSVTVALLGMLLVHLLFTIRYHMPLSKLNYSLQVSAVVVCLINVAAELEVVMHTLRRTGRTEPWTFDYIEVLIPPSRWDKGERGAWLLLQALAAMLVHLTHIQFLTMLFPSELEAKLILGLLGPLALAAAGLYFTALSPHATVNDLGDAIRNTCNSSLTLLYTFALFVWGLTLNRSRAWRAEGGTATFGSVAMILGVLGVAVNFIEIKEDRMRWLPSVIDCVLLWQSWVGFWWWVGAGMWTGEAEDVERRDAKKKKRAEAKLRKREAKERLDKREGGGSAIGSAASGPISLRRRPMRPSRQNTTEEIELQELGPSASSGANAPAAANATNNTARPAGSRSGRRPAPSSDASDSSGSTPPPSHHFYSPVVAWLSPFFLRLRDAHDEAAVARAALPPRLPDDVRRGWGLRALMLRGKRERGEMRQAVGTQGDGELRPDERRAGFEADGGIKLAADDSEDAATTESGADDRRLPRASGAPIPPPPPIATVPRETGEEPVQRNWAWRGMEGQGRTWTSLLARWRLKDVSHF
ncbi:BQ2448_850 [Microbotryum intermedium]|uniref:BQ2448_850 protein n=1 Tax=Microbotryum intermedium TaxID=269621 RepID=A0A238F7K0_9BASI|nr:BQ2448_850 [Microbotryum intermedium]